MPPRRTGQPGPLGGEILVADDGSEFETDPQVADALEAEGLVTRGNPGPMLADASGAIPQGGAPGMLQGMQMGAGRPDPGLAMQAEGADEPVTPADPRSGMLQGMRLSGSAGFDPGTYGSVSGTAEEDGSEEEQAEAPPRAAGVFNTAIRGRDRATERMFSRAAGRASREARGATAARREAMEDIANARGEALGAQAEGEREKAVTLLEAQEIQRQAIEEAQLERARVMEEQQAIRRRLDERLGELEEMESAIRQEEIDPNRVYGEPGSAGSIAAAIGVALGSLGSSFAGGPNTALQIMQERIQNDIQAQKANLANKRASIEGERTLYQEIRSRADSELEADLMMTDLMYQDALRQVQAMSSDLESQDAMARARTLEAQIEEQQAQVRAQIQGEIEASATQRAGAARRGAAAARRRGDQNPNLPPGYTFVPGQERELGTAEAREIRGTVAGADSTQARVRQLMGMIDRFSTGDRISDAIIGTGEGDRIRQAAGALRLDYQSAMKGNPSDKDLELINEIAGGDFTGFRTDRLKARLRGLAENAAQSRDATLGAYGVTRAGGGGRNIRTRRPGGE